MRFFDTVEMAPPDPILGLNAAFKADPRSNKVNLSIGAYKTDDLQPLVLTAVKKAEQQILTEGMDKEYLSQDGDPEYVRRSIRLVFNTEQDNIFGAPVSFSLKSEVNSSTFPIPLGRTTTKFLQGRVWRSHRIRIMMRSVGSLPSRV